MHSHDIHIKCLSQANEEDRLAIFIGSGVSKSSDNDFVRLPLWSDLIKELKSELSIEEEFEPTKIAQLYYLEYGEQRYLQTLKKHFPDNISGSDLHREILKVNPRVIITTNWDCILENTIENEGYLYDIICTDKDLVASTSPRKLLKIHGDFKSHNIVFKEDDYIYYSRDFPLLENYIKSIFSTHTVLFLGYSYNDINLKHIMKWVQSHSSSVPAMYLTSFKSDKPQENYLKNHGISTLVLLDDKFRDAENLTSKNKSDILQRFLNSIVVGKELYLPKHEDEREIISFMFNRIKHLGHQGAVSRDQINDALTNCGFYYDIDGLCLLNLYRKGGVLTTDIDDSVRECFEGFTRLLLRVDGLSESEKIEFYKSNMMFNDIFSVLALANIKGVMLPDEDGRESDSYFPNHMILPQDELKLIDREYISFSDHKCSGDNSIKSLLCDSYIEYRLGRFDLAFKKTADLILACKRNRIYSMLLIAVFNRNCLLWHLKYGISDAKSGSLENEVDIELQDEFFKFPKLEIKKNQSLYDFLTFKTVNEIAYKCSRKIDDLMSRVGLIKAGGMSFDNNADQPAYEHVNLLQFALKNHIMIDRYAPFSSAMQDYLRISLVRQSLSDVVLINQYEIYTAIQFYPPKNLKKVLSAFIDGNDNKSLLIGESCTEWLIGSVLCNLTTSVLNDKNYFSGCEARFENCIFLLSLVPLSDIQIGNVITEFSRLVASKATTIGIYESLNNFLGIQGGLYSKVIDSELLIDILNIIIDKIVSKKAQGFDNHAVLQGRVRNIYSSIKVASVEYADVQRVSELISEIKTYPIDVQASYSRSIIYSIFLISSTPVKNIIRKYINKLLTEFEKNNVVDVEFYLWAVATKFKEYDSKLLSYLDAYFEQYRGGKGFPKGLNGLLDLIGFLVKNIGISELQDIYNEIIGLSERSDNGQFVSKL